MTHPTINNGWNKFAKDISGQTSFSSAGSFSFDNTFQIKTPSEIIKLVWADQPEKNRGPFVNSKTFFYYNIGQPSKKDITIYKKDLLSNLLTIFKSSKIKTGDAVLDKQYLFFSKDKLLIGNLYNDFKVFNDKNEFKDFVIDTELIGMNKFLVIQVNSLLTDEKVLRQFYKLGLSISKELNGGV
ncbi:MAG TPA: hypothetical protein DCQ50_21470 [Chryseobacterium sp.]|nr:hypothetical protein [Chryseobacterium sp.]